MPKTETETPVAIICEQVPKDAPEGSLAYSKRSLRLYIREGGNWQLLGQVLPPPLDETKGLSQAPLRLQGRPH